MENVGDINEKGYIAGMTRRGYTPQKCILELIANSLDAHDKVENRQNFNPKIAFDVKRQTISQIDNGIGMTALSLQKLFSLHRENHASDQSRGVSGIGAKPAQSILSNKTKVEILTRHPDGVHLHAEAPWDQIHLNGVYTGMIKVREMTEDERAEFYREREENGMLTNGFAHGTSIRFNYSDNLKHLLMGNFLPIEHAEAEKNPLDRIGVVFGHDNVPMILRSYENPDPPMNIMGYNYFDAPDSEFYTGKSEHTIEHWYNSRENRFVLVTPTGYEEITRFGGGLSKEPKSVPPISRMDYRLVGHFTVKCGMRYDNNLFNPDDPKMFGGSKDNQGHFNLEHLGDNETFLGSFKLIRNNQTIGLIAPPDIRITSARAGGDTYLDIILVQAEIIYYPVGNQDNQQDCVMGIQENKNQFDGSCVPITLTRIAQALKKQKGQKIRDYFDDCIERFNARRGQVVDDITDSSEEEEDAAVPAPTPAPVAPVPTAAVSVPPADVDDTDEEFTENSDAVESDESDVIETPPINNSERGENVETPMIRKMLGNDIIKNISPTTLYDRDTLILIMAELFAH